MNLGHDLESVDFHRRIDGASASEKIPVLAPMSSASFGVAAEPAKQLQRERSRRIRRFRRPNKISGDRAAHRIEENEPAAVGAAFDLGRLTGKADTGRPSQNALSR